METFFDSLFSLENFNIINAVIDPKGKGNPELKSTVVADNKKYNTSLSMSPSSFILLFLYVIIIEKII